MGRTARFGTDQILSGALDLLAERGPTGVTMAQIGISIGAPIGSLYHRFASRDLLMARLWLSVVDAFQEGFLDALARPDGLAAALHTPRWARRHLREGEVLLLFRREELIGGPWPAEMSGHAAVLAQRLDEGLRAFVREQFGQITSRTMRTARFVLIDVPCGATRPHLERREVVPPVVDRLIEKAYRSIMGGSDENSQRA